MSSESDNIEAKLAAYIDGQLPESERAEIEKYLANNPQQAQVLRDLTHGRELLAGLEKASAPPEIMEAMQASLERAQLLERPVEEEASTGRGRWRQVFAIAAILVLAVGLAGLVYWVTHPPGIPKYSVAEMSAAKPITTEESAKTTEDAVNTGAAPAAPSTSIVIAAPEGAFDGAERMLKAGGATGGATGGALAASAPALAETLAAQPPPSYERLSLSPLPANTPAPGAAQTLQFQNSPSQNALTQNLLTQSAPTQTVLVTRDVNRARAKVTEYLASNNIAYEFAAAPQNGNAPQQNVNAPQQTAELLESRAQRGQNQVIIARRVPADKVNEITRTLQGRPLIVSALDQEQVAGAMEKKAYFADKVRDRQLTTQSTSAPATQEVAAAAVGAASQPATESTQEVDLTIVFSPEPATAPVDAPVEAPVLANEPAKVPAIPNEPATRPAPNWLKTKAGIQYEK
jgi:hypothetical protein